MSEATRGTLKVFDDAAALTDAAAVWLCERALASSGRFAVALAGGGTPGPMYRKLAQSPIVGRFPWDRVHWFWGDERHVPHDHPDSNYRLAADALLDIAPVPRANIHPVPIDGLTPQQSAAAYAQVLKDWYASDTLDPAKPLLDVNLLGIGDDGHFASLIPGQPVLDEKKLWVAAVPHGRPEPRITLTYPALESCAFAVFLVAGEGKADALSKARRADASVPTGRFRPHGELIWFADRSAAGN
jgi:6-phosphogluconolactonase